MQYIPEEVDIYSIGMVLLHMANMGFPKEPEDAKTPKDGDVEEEKKKKIEKIIEDVEKKFN